MGEAANPGSVVSMPGDGNCLFHSLGYWARQDQRQVREAVAEGAITVWGDISGMPWLETAR